MTCFRDGWPVEVCRRSRLDLFGEDVGVACVAGNFGDHAQVMNRRRTVSTSLHTDRQTRHHALPSGSGLT
jgi:hypothetical protein